MEKWKETVVWWDDDYKSWALTAYDADGNTVSAGGYNEHHEHYAMKYDAVEAARAYKAAGRCDKLTIKTKSG